MAQKGSTGLGVRELVPKRRSQVSHPFCNLASFPVYMGESYLPCEADVKGEGNNIFEIVYLITSAHKY